MGLQINICSYVDRSAVGMQSKIDTSAVPDRSAILLGSVGRSAVVPV